MTSILPLIILVAPNTAKAGAAENRSCASPAESTEQRRVHILHLSLPQRGEVIHGLPCWGELDLDPLFPVEIEQARCALAVDDDFDFLSWARGGVEEAFPAHWAGVFLYHSRVGDW